MKDNYVAQQLVQYYNWNNADKFQSPVAELEKIMNEISNDLKRYMASPNPKQGYIDKQKDLIRRLYAIIEQLQSVEPLDVWARINEHIRRATAVGDADYIKMFIPLKLNLPTPNFLGGVRLNSAIVDLAWASKLDLSDYHIL